MRPAAGLGSRGALWRRRRRVGQVLTRGVLDPNGLTGIVDGERGFVLARRISGERALPTVGRAVLVSPERLCRHVLVCGATGSGKTETLLRLAWAVAKCTGAPVFYLDGKGDRDTARRFCALMSDAGRQTRVFPVDAFDGWRGEPHEIQGRLMQIVDYATVGPASWYRDIAKTTLGLVCGHPQGPPRSELYPEVVDAREEEGGVPSRLTKTDRRKAGKEGTPCQMFAGSPSGRTTRAGSRSMTSRVRVRVG